MTNYTVKMSVLAQLTLYENIFFLSNFNFSYSQKVKQQIFKEIHNLIIFPHFHPIYKKTNNFIYRKLIVYKRYHIIYTVIHNTIFIFYMIDGRQQFDKYFNLLK